MKVHGTFKGLLHGAELIGLRMPFNVSVWCSQWPVFVMCFMVIEQFVLVTSSFFITVVFDV